MLNTNIAQGCSILQKATKSILSELDDLLIHKDKQHLIENKATHLINAAINLINLIKENYDDTTANDLERRLLGSIKSQDTAKFTRGIRKAK